jgi:hypothetical protein
MIDSAILEECVTHFWSAINSNSQPSIVVNPSERSLGTPTDKPQVRFHALHCGEPDVVQFLVDEVDLDEIPNRRHYLNTVRPVV